MKEWEALAAPAATLIAGLLAVVLGWWNTTNRYQRLRLAADVCAILPEQLQREWQEMVTRDAEYVMRRAHRNLLVPGLYLASLSCYSIAFLVPSSVALNIVAVLLAFTALGVVLVRRRRTLREITKITEEIAGLKAGAEKDRAYAIELLIHAGAKRDFAESLVKRDLEFITSTGSFPERNLALAALEGNINSFTWRRRRALRRGLAFLAKLIARSKKK